MVHLNELGVISNDTAMAHCVHVDDHELDIMAEAGCSVEHCPTTALKVAYGVTQIGKIPEMVMRGINVSIGIDGNNASNYSDMYRATYLVAGLFKDARMDAQMFPAEKAYEMATLGGARTMLMEDEIGSLEVGKKADLVMHDTDRPEWRPLLNVMNQLVWSADGRGVHTVFRRRRQGRRGWTNADHRRGGAVGRRPACRRKRSSRGAASPTSPNSRFSELLFRPRRPGWLEGDAGAFQ